MQLGAREEPGRGRVRTVVWAEGSESDLDAVVVGSVAVALCTVGVVAALNLHGLLQTLAVGLAVVAGLYAALMLVPLVVILVGVFLIRGMAGPQSSAQQHRTGLIIAGLGAAVIGGALGADAYVVGSPGLLTGPALVAIAVVALQALPSVSARTRHRVIGLAVVAAVAAVIAGLTIFA